MSNAISPKNIYIIGEFEHSYEVALAYFVRVISPRIHYSCRHIPACGANETGHHSNRGALCEPNAEDNCARMQRSAQIAWAAAARLSVSKPGTHANDRSAALLQ